ncbi:MAG: ferritin-like domain-containing protein [Acidobacteriia bacterium]|nr:ferritin-like domain-containing protein [Terriglobia bacterium]
MNSKEFVEELHAANQKLLDRLRSTEELSSGPEAGMSIRNLLKIAMKNEIEATELAALWMPTTETIDIKMAWARQVGDEAKHYRLIQDRLRQLGEPIDHFNPLAKGYTALFKFLSMLHGTVDRIAAAQFTREAIAVVKNEQFIALCEAKGDPETARLYREIIQPDERFHFELGRNLLEKYATTDELQTSARMTARQTLELAEELQGLIFQETGVHHAPGC